MRTLFISDLHLSHHSPAITSGFFNFLKTQSATADRLYILGDFFDAWIGDDFNDPLIQQIKTALAELAARCPIYFLHGNRDFLLGNRFAAETGIQLLPETEVVDLDGRRALLMHGDSLCTQDLEYMKFRAMVRNPAWQQQVLSLPLAQRIQMAADLRSKSKSMNAMKAEDIMDVTPEEVAKVMTANGVDLLIHGHTHRPARHTLTVNNAPAERWVLGDWGNTGWYLEAENGALNLIQFDLVTLNPVKVVA